MSFTAAAAIVVNDVVANAIVVDAVVVETTPSLTVR